MPVINEYHSRPVSIQPTGRGMQEWETTARRAGPLYNAAAQDVRERGKLAADAIEDQGWQMNFLRAYHQLREDNAEAAAEAYAQAHPQINISLRGGRGGGGSYPGGSSASAGGIIGGAVGLSQVAASDAYGPTNDRLVPKGINKGGKIYDVDEEMEKNRQEQLKKDAALGNYGGGSDIGGYGGGGNPDYVPSERAVGPIRNEELPAGFPLPAPKAPSTPWTFPNPLDWISGGGTSNSSDYGSAPSYSERAAEGREGIQ